MSDHDEWRWRKTPQMWWTEWEGPPRAHVCECLVPSWWNSLGGLRMCDFAGDVWGWRFKKHTPFFISCLGPVVQSQQQRGNWQGGRSELPDNLANSEAMCLSADKHTQIHSYAHTWVVKHKSEDSQKLKQRHSRSLQMTHQKKNRTLAKFWEVEAMV